MVVLFAAFLKTGDLPPALFEYWMNYVKHLTLIVVLFWTAKDAVLTGLAKARDAILLLRQRVSEVGG